MAHRIARFRIARFLSLLAVSRALRRSAVAAGAVLLAALLPSAAAADSAVDWPMFGQNPQNTASARGPARAQVRQLAPKWTFTTGGDVSARAAVVHGIVYFPDWGGNLWAVNARTGAKVWGHQLSDYGLPANTHSRTSPAVADGVVYVGTQEGAWLLAIDALHGELLWKTQLESAATDPYAVITASPAVVGGLVYTGLASLQENAAVNPAFACCTARGSVVALRARDGGVVWKTYTVPPGYSGGGVWGSNFAIDRQRKTVFVGTGNNYSAPTDVAYAACVGEGGTPAACMSVDNHIDAIIALDSLTGAVKWASKALAWSQPGIADGTDTWNVACLAGFPPGQGNCPVAAGPDYDFASAPNLITYRGKNGLRTILGAGQKSGIYYAFDPDTGAELWRTQVGPGSSLGGMEWGSASDGKKIFVSIANLYGIPSAAGSAGSWAALDPETGAILWQTADPNGAIAVGALAVAGDVVYVSSMAGAADAPTMLALNAADGQVVWSFAAGSSVNAGAAVVGASVYWGSGYTHLGIPGYTGNNRFYAFSPRSNATDD